MFSSRPQLKRMHWDSDRSYFLVDCPQHNPTNPILYAAREDIVTWVDRAAAYEWWAGDFDLVPDIPEQRHPEHVDHARRVLTRLARLAERTEAV